MKTIFLLLLATILASLANASDEGLDVLFPYNFTDSDRKLMLDLHNHARKCSDPPGRNQVMMTWNNDLEKESVNLSRLCIMEHSDNAWGENIALNGPWKAETDPARWQKYIKVMFDLWLSEVNDMDYEKNTCSNVCGHYTAIVNSKNYQVGCGMSLCAKVKHDTGRIYGKGTLLFCRFNVLSESVYIGNGRYRPYDNGTRCAGCKDSDTCIEGMCADRVRDGDVDYDTLVTADCPEPTDADEKVEVEVFADNSAQEEEVQGDESSARLLHSILSLLVLCASGALAAMYD